MGPDNISTIMLEHVGPVAIRSLIRMLSVSLTQQKIPGIWIITKIVPLLKPNKPDDDSSSYRPISLLSPVAKTLKKLILSRFMDDIILAPHQHGFRKSHSTTTTLPHITQKISDGANKKKNNKTTQQNYCRCNRSI